MQSLWLIFVVFFLIVLVVPIFTKIHASFDFLHNIGTLSLYIFFIKIFAYKIKIENKSIVLISKKGKEFVETQISEKQLKFLKQLNIQFKQKIIVKNLDIYARVGSGDAFGTALLVGLVNSFGGGILALIKNTKKSSKIAVICEPDYNGVHFTVSAAGKFSITLFDIIYSFLMSFIIIKRSDKYERV